WGARLIMRCGCCLKCKICPLSSRISKLWENKVEEIPVKLTVKVKTKSSLKKYTAFIFDEVKKIVIIYYVYYFSYQRNLVSMKIKKNDSRLRRNDYEYEYCIDRL